jgi:hypothetical protein
MTKSKVPCATPYDVCVIPVTAPCIGQWMEISGWFIQHYSIGWVAPQPLWALSLPAVKFRFFGRPACTLPFIPRYLCSLKGVTALVDMGQQKAQIIHTKKRLFRAIKEAFVFYLFILLTEIIYINYLRRYHYHHDHNHHYHHHHHHHHHRSVGIFTEKLLQMINLSEI